MYAGFMNQSKGSRAQISQRANDGIDLFPVGIFNESQVSLQSERSATKDDLGFTVNQGPNCIDL
jgi:hypothetical protein